MPSHKGIVCTVSVDGVSAEEFGTKTEGSIITCSIVAQDDKPFVFNLDFSNSTASRHDFNAYVDGVKVFYFTTTDPTAIIYRSSAAVDGVFEMREMRFSRLSTVDQKLDVMETRTDVLQNIGSLKVLVFRAEKEATECEATGGKASENIKDIHEKSLKGRAVSHRTSFGPVEYRTSPAFNTKKLDPPHHPYVTFVFLYASKSYLQSEGLVPRSPSPDPSTEDYEGKSVDEMSPEDLRRELLRYRAQDRDEKKSIKRERERDLVPCEPAASGDDNDEEEVVFQSGRRIKKQKVIEVIDLLSDD
ncbi:hypothetical protein TWF481_008578 [Arthrobotrys musiformis]|uniref:DUF7918 domain-containing protein n=1 Tax=Arthrobotrys musiformis TaxID=47236 RepID=A0AAV9W9D1_9PEZI